VATGKGSEGDEKQGGVVVVGAPAQWQHWRRGPAVIYKGRGKGPAKHPRCICCFPKSVAGQEVPLRYGVRLVLCADHRDPRFLHSRGGRDFLAATSALFRSLGLTGRRYHEALMAFLEEVRDTGRPTPRRRPGSYAWPDLRRDAEQAWHCGATFEQGCQLVYTHEEPITRRLRLPSLATVRRWWREKRWMLPRPAPGRKPATASTPPGDPLDDRAVMLHVTPPFRAGPALSGPGRPP
jgi:hypothetical protein